MTVTVYDVLYGFFSMTSSFYIAAAAIVFINCFYDPGVTWSKKKALMLSIYTVVKVLTDFLGLQIPIVNILLYAVYVIIPIYDCKGKRIRRALRFISIYTLILICVSSIILIAFTYFVPGFDLNTADYSPAEVTAINIFCTLFFGLVFHYLRHRIVPKGLFIPCGKREGFMGGAYAFFVFSVYCIVFASEEESEIARAALIVLAFVSILFMLLFPIFLYYTRISSHYRTLNEYQESYLQAELAHFKQYKSAQEETARFRHDIRNNLICLNELMSSDRYSEASEYLSSLLSEVQSLSPKYVSGDEILDCIISSKASAMTQQSISFSLDGVFPGGIGWNSTDICSVFANALDNAIDACVQLPEDQRRISMSIRSTDKFHFVNIENPVFAEIDTSRLFSEKGGFTTKTSGGTHGIGTYNIKRTVEKYGGAVRAECADGLFKLELMINKIDPISQEKIAIHDTQPAVYDKNHTAKGTCDIIVPSSENGGNHMELSNKKALRKTIRKDGSKLGFSLLWYFLINLSIVVFWLIGQFVAAQINHPEIMSDPAASDLMLNQIIDRFEKSGASMIAGCVIGLFFLFLFFLGRGTHKTLFARNQKMTVGRFAGVACVFFGTQLIFQGMYWLMEKGLNLIGYSAEVAMESATGTSETLSMFIYAGIVAPIIEELIFRGFALKFLEKYGKNLAIVVSSLLFGVMHANLPQAIFAFFVGLVLGYVASKYSIIWSIVLHILNNLVLGDLLSKAVEHLSEDVQNIIFYAVMGIFLVIGIIVLIVKRKEIMTFIRENKSEKGTAFRIVTSAGILIFVILHILMAIGGLEKI